MKILGKIISSFIRRAALCFSLIVLSFTIVGTVAGVESIGKGLAMIAAVVNPEIFVVGGGVSKAGDVLFDYICPVYDRLAFYGSKDAKFALATLGNDAGIFGAAALVL